VSGEVVSDEFEGLVWSLFGEFGQGLEDDRYDSAVEVLTNRHGLEVFSLCLIRELLIMAYFWSGMCLRLIVFFIIIIYLGFFEYLI
jgi:hypothetical protein